MLIFVSWTLSPLDRPHFYPVARKLGEIAMRFTPQNAMNSISRKLELAGTSARVDPTMILALQLFLGAVFAAIVVLVSSLGAELAA
jgi:tight adherence protein C